ncbi:MAG: hypothetical protein KAY68_00480, partial [Azonexus sp.]|nr:hypothetical protein [Azonexus sp.]
GNLAGNQAAEDAAAGRRIVNEKRHANFLGLAGSDRPASINQGQGRAKPVGRLASGGRRLEWAAPRIDLTRGSRLYKFSCPFHHPAKVRKT